MALNYEETNFIMNCISDGFEIHREVRKARGLPEFQEIDCGIMDIERFVDMMSYIQDLLLTGKTSEERYNEQWTYAAPDCSFTDDVVNKLRENGIIFHKDGVCGVKINVEDDLRYPMIQLLIEDDGTLYGKNFEINPYFINNLIDVLNDTKQYLKDRKKENKNAY